MKQIDYEEGKKLVATHSCGECGSPLLLPWGGSYGIEGHIIRCSKDINHEGFVKQKTFYRAWKDGEEVPLVIKNHFEKQRRKQMETQVGEEGTTALETYIGTTALTQKQASYILKTIWPDAPSKEVVKAAILCHQYQLNPLMKHLFLLPFKNRRTGETDWSMVLGIGATRLIASRRRPYSYADGPRIMTEEEQKSIFGKVDVDNICAITVIDDGNGHRAPGYGKWPKDTEPQGTEKGNTKENMAFIRSERNAFNRLLPGEMPSGVDVMEEQYVDDVKYKTFDPDKDVPSGDSSQSTEHPWIKACPEHGIAWRSGQYGLFHALDEQKDGKTQWCKASAVFGEKFSKAREMLGWDKSKGDEWLKQEFGGTWSKIADGQRIDAIDRINAMLLTGRREEEQGELVPDELPF